MDDTRIFRSLQTGRAIAAILVVLCHTGGVLALPKYFDREWLAMPFAFGRVGVEFFFVLSGFIIAWTHWDEVAERINLRRYALKRFIRIYPIYWLVFMATFGACALSPTLWNSVPHDLPTLIRALALMPNDPSSGFSGTGAPVLIVAWTLQYEVFFYALFGLFLFDRRGAYLVALLILVSIFLLWPHSYISEFLRALWTTLFLLGVIAARLAKARFSLGSPRHFMGLAIGAIVGLGIVESVNPSEYWRVPGPIAYGVPCGLIVLLMAQMELNGELIIESRLLQILGAASYSIYLVHFPLISILAKLGLVLHLRWNWQMVGYFLFVAAFSLLFGCAVHVFVEVPLLKFLYQLSRGRGRYLQSPDLAGPGDKSSFVADESNRR